MLKYLSKSLDENPDRKANSLPAGIRQGTGNDLAGTPQLHGRITLRQNSPAKTEITAGAEAPATATPAAEDAEAEQTQDSGKSRGNLAGIASMENGRRRKGEEEREKGRKRKGGRENEE